MPYPLFDRFYSPYGPVATFLVEGVQPPAAQYIGPSDQLQLTVFSPNVPTTFMLGLRLLDLKGQVQPLSYKIIVPATAGGSFVEVITPGECFLLSAVVDQANVKRGQCFVRLNLQRGNPTGGAAVGMVLIAGYATATDTIGFPQSRAEPSTEGKGASLVYTGAVPVAGSPATLTVPPGTRWHQWMAAGVLQAGGLMSSRVVFTVTTGGGASKVLFVVPTQVPDAAGNLNYVGGPGYNGSEGGAIDGQAGDVFSLTQISGVDPGNQFSALTVTAEEFVEL